MGTVTLITGGVRAGKTAFALTQAQEHGGPVTYVATAEAGDGEMAARIARHRAERPPHWQTLEAPLDPVGALTHARPQGVVILDCLTVWTSNLLLRALPDEDISAARIDDAIAGIEGAARGLVAWAAAADADLIVVSNEVGWGVVPAYALGRAYRDALGKANQIVAAAAARVYLVVAGLALELRAAGAVRIGPHP